MIINFLLLIFIIYLIGVALDAGGLYFSSYFADKSKIKASKICYKVMIIGEFITDYILLIAIFIIILLVKGS